MKYIFCITICLFIFTCEREVVTPSPIDYNTDVYLNALFVFPDSTFDFQLDLSYLNRAYEPGLAGFERSGAPSLVAFLGEIRPRENQSSRECYSILPIENVEDELAIPQPGFVNPTAFMEFVGLENGREDCQFDQSFIENQLHLGAYPLGQKLGQVHFHIYANPVYRSWHTNDFFLSDMETNEGLVVNITELDYRSSIHTGIPGVYISFNVPLAYGYNSVFGLEYEMHNLEGRLFFPLLPS